ncbi:glutamate receptor 2.7-like isoform X2 [Diospyros lotus]|uniref:glutamate receptor 2.7-like isoform X2 n=1 Tax=Diospyros lotus TaxID=55363 RepID=UPI002259C493|nr:glutamate receptor 2.7-like isoform X2 [Diospyros lotus]
MRNLSPQVNFFYIAFVLIMILPSMAMAYDQLNNSGGATAVHVGVVLDMKGMLGKMGLSCISMALSDFYASHASYRTKVVLKPRDSKGDDLGAAAAALYLLKYARVHAIVGPSTSTQADFVIDLGTKAQVPIISFSTTSPSLSPLRTPYFVRVAQNDSSQAKAIAAIIRAFGWREVIPIYVDNAFGEGIMPSMADALHEIDARIPYRSIIPPSATGNQIFAELYKLKTKQTRVFIVHMFPYMASQLFMKAKEIGMMSDEYVWIITDAVGNDLTSLDPQVIDSMQGVLGVKPYVVPTKQLENFRGRWKTKFKQGIDADLNVFGLWAYDAATALAMAVEVVGATNTIAFLETNASRKSTDLETLAVSQMGPKLIQALKNAKFQGLSGHFQMVDGQLHTSAYQVVNVIGNGHKGIGFWTAEKGLTKGFNLTSTTTVAYSTSKDNLGSIIWPGDTTSPPKGRVDNPLDGKKLRIGVPLNTGFTELVKAYGDNKTWLGGYCIEVFNAVMAKLPYPVAYEFIAFVTPDGKSAGTNNELVEQVYKGNFDAAVGDITIAANRSNYVDFSFPFTESGVAVVVQLKDEKKKNAWVFLKPLTWDLWLTSLCSFVSVGFVIWVLEHRINVDFRGPPSYQAGTIFWFAFSTMVFAQKERIVSNLGRFVVIVWCFVVLILIQSYTASLTSMLTVQHLQPSVTDLSELIKRNKNVGCQDGSFVKNILEELGFNESRSIKIYKSSEELDELFRNGSIAAAFDEIPYMQVFLSKYCSKYTMLPPTNRTDGFGFAFPIGSPLVNDVSRAVLSVTRGKLVDIGKALYNDSNCPDSSNSLSSNNVSLGVESFWGLFLIAGLASLSALVIYTIMFVHEHKHILNQLEPNASTMEKIIALANKFDKKALSSHTFKKPGFQDGNTNGEFRNEVHEILGCHKSSMEKIHATLHTVLSELQSLRASQNCVNNQPETNPFAPTKSFQQVNPLSTNHSQPSTDCIIIISD